MCFSAQASFAASAALVPAGIYCVKSAARKNRAFLLVALVPFGFSVQQLCEGLVWLGLAQEDVGLVKPASVAYLFFAMAFWPIWVPLCIWISEDRAGAKQLLGTIVILSVVWLWLYMPIPLEPDRWLTTQIVHHSIRYDYLSLPGFDVAPSDAWRLGYLLFVAVPLGVAATRPRSSGRGVLSLVAVAFLVMSFTVASFVFWYAFTSVWCFFAAMLALFLCYFFAEMPAARSEPRARSFIEQATAASQTND